jgi:hypothetical protein
MKKFLFNVPHWVTLAHHDPARSIRSTVKKPGIGINQLTGTRPHLGEKMAEKSHRNLQPEEASKVLTSSPSAPATRLALK